MNFKLVSFFYTYFHVKAPMPCPEILRQSDKETGAAVSLAKLTRQAKQKCDSKDYNKLK